MDDFHYIQMCYYKWIRSYGKTISERNVTLWSIECAEKTDFVQPLTSLSNEIANPLWYNYTDKCQGWVSLKYCHLNSCFMIIIFIHEERLGVFYME